GSVEYLWRAFAQDHGRDRAEVLAPFDVIEARQVLRAAGIGQQAAMAESPRTELAAPLEPGHHPVAGYHLGHRAGDVGRPLVTHSRRFQALPQIVRGPPPPQR